LGILERENPMSQFVQLVRIASTVALQLLAATSLTAQTLPLEATPELTPGARWSGGLVSGGGTDGGMLGFQVGRHTPGSDWILMGSARGWEGDFVSGTYGGFSELALLRGWRNDSGQGWQRVAIGPAITTELDADDGAGKDGFGIVARADLGADVGAFTFGLHLLAGLNTLRSHAGAGFSISVGSTSFGGAR
jgi:hypothetical protein